MLEKTPPLGGKLLKLSRKKAPQVEVAKGGAPVETEKMDVVTLVGKLPPDYVPRINEPQPTVEEGGVFLSGKEPMIDVGRFKIESMRKGIEIHRRAMQRLATREAQEVREAQRLEDRGAWEEMIDSLNTDAKNAAQKGDVVLSKQLEEASQALVRRMEADSQVAKFRASVAQHTDDDLKLLADVIVRDKERREMKLEHKGTSETKTKQNRLEDIIAGVDDEVLENMTRGMGEEMRERAEEQAVKERNMSESEAITAKLEEEENDRKKDVAKNGSSLEKELAAFVQKKVVDSRESNPKDSKDTPKLENRPEENEAQETSQVQWEQPYKDERETQRKANPPQETTPEQWEEHYRDAFSAKKGAEAHGWSVSVEKLSQAVKETAVERGKIIDEKTPEEHKGFVRKIAERYRAMPMWSRMLVGGLLFTGAMGSALIGGPASTMVWSFWLAQRAASGIGAWAAVDGMTEKMKNRYIAGILSGGAGVAALFLPSTIQYLDQTYHISDSLRDYFGFNGDKTVTNEGAKGDKLASLFNKNAIPSVPGYVDALFNQSFSVREGDNVWNILKANLKTANLITDSMPEGVINRKLAIIQNHLSDLGPEKIKEILKIRSGNIHLIRPGENVDFSIIDKMGWLNEIK
ncbi:MAG: hypothetical protein Q7S26_00015 [bacterium]|nr:hypothetical protein [bacterium]